MPFYNGVDPDFPYLDENERFAFPKPGMSPNKSLIAWGGNLSPGMLLSAYEQGLFPWYSEGEPIIWHSPDPRYVIFPEDLHISSSMKKIIKKGEFTVTFDRNFPAIIRACAEIFRPDQGATWITEDMINAYIEIHNLGWAHSSEAWKDGELVGGCYGLRLGNIFFGESMFSLKPNASKTAFLKLASFLFEDNVSLIDCQTHTYHLQNLGAREIPRDLYLALLGEHIKTRAEDININNFDRRGSWSIFNT